MFSVALNLYCTSTVGSRYLVFSFIFEFEFYLRDFV